MLIDIIAGTTIIAKLDRALYPQYARNWDDELFRQRRP